MALTIVAQITAVAGKEQLVRSELEKLIETTRNEAGCLQYDLHQDNDNPCFFIFFENWENRELWQQHMAAPHLAAYLVAVEGSIADFSVHEMQKIGG